MFNSDLQERYNMFGDGLILRSLNYIDNYRLIKEVKLPSNSTYSFEFTSPVNGHIAFYQLRKTALNFPDADEVEEYCNKLFPTLPLDLVTPALDQFYQLDKNGNIIKDNKGLPCKRHQSQFSIKSNRRNCFFQYMYGNIFLLINNSKKQTLFNKKISIFGGQSVNVKKDELLYITINTKISQDTKVAPTHRYNIYLKIRNSK